MIITIEVATEERKIIKEKNKNLSNNLKMYNMLVLELNLYGVDEI